jgi:hypothetical protein
MAREAGHHNQVVQAVLEGLRYLLVYQVRVLVMHMHNPRLFLHSNRCPGSHITIRTLTCNHLIIRAGICNPLFPTSILNINIIRINTRILLDRLVNHTWPCLPEILQCLCKAQAHPL